MISELPIELKLNLLEICCDSNLKFSSSEFYRLNNQLYKSKLACCLDLDKIDTLLSQFLGSFEYWNSELKELLKPEKDYEFVYSIFQNRKVFFQLEDFSVEPGSEVEAAAAPETSSIYFKNVSAFQYSKPVYLPNGIYNFQVGIRCKSFQTSGLGSTKFTLTNEDLGFSLVKYPPPYIQDLIPSNRIVVLNFGQFVVQDSQFQDDRGLTKFEIRIEEMGMIPKFGFYLEYIDFQPAHEEYFFYSFDQYDAVSEYDLIVNPMEKQLHLAIDTMLRKDIVPDFKELYLHSCNNSFASLSQLEISKQNQSFYTNSKRSVSFSTPFQQRQFNKNNVVQENSGPSRFQNWRVPKVTGTPTNVSTTSLV